jgi:hypothetical protein
MMNVKLAIDEALSLGADPADDGDEVEFNLSGGEDYDISDLAEMFTLAELNMLQTHLDTFGAVLQGAIHERTQMNIRARMTEKGII